MWFLKYLPAAIALAFVLLLPLVVMLISRRASNRRQTGGELSLVEPPPENRTVHAYGKRKRPSLAEYMAETPRDRWPRYLQDTADRAARLGISVREVIDEDTEVLANMHLSAEEVDEVIEHMSQK